MSKRHDQLRNARPKDLPGRAYAALVHDTRGSREDLRVWSVVETDHIGPDTGRGIAVDSV